MKKFTRTHEWVELNGERAKVGITDYAQKELGDLVYINLPSVGDRVKCGVAFCDVESVKAVSEINSPICGRVTAVNEELGERPELINEDALGAWICEVQVEKAGELMSEEEYKALIAR